ncbi:invasion associated locus B family protein [Magnetococcus marinus]|nr:invasion associated locus B family protein [Magnetococcus marinus]
MQRFVNGFVFSVMLLGMVLLAEPVYAQATFSRSQAYKDWLLQCFEVPVAGQKAEERCTLTQNVGTQKVKRIASLSLIKGGEGRKESFLRLILPLEMYLGEKVTMVVDEESAKPEILEWLTCVTDGCLAELKMTKPLLQKLEKGTALNFNASLYNGRRKLAMKFSLLGFTDGNKQVQ